MFAQIISALKILFGMESQPLPKDLFVTVFSKIHRLNKIDVLCTLQDSSFFQKFLMFLLLLYTGVQ